MKHGGLEVGGLTLEADEERELYAYVFKTRADPYAGRVNFFRVYQGVMDHDTTVMNTRTHHKERIGQLVLFQGKETVHADAFGPGDIGAVAKLKETRAGDWLAERDEPITMPSIALPAPVMAFAMEPKSRGDEDKVITGLRRLQEEDPTIELHRDQQTGEQIVAGPVADPRRGGRRAAEVALRRGGHAQDRRACPTRRRSAGAPRPTAATRSRRAGAASSATATSRSSRCATGPSTSSTPSRAA